ncbi:MAG: ABC transporter ATP-binding protein [Acidimicrobiia bacterium]
MIVVDDVVKHYGRESTALDGISFEVGMGEFVGVSGPSGSGKSTLLHLLAALDAPSSGRIVVEGRDLSTRRGIDKYRRLEVGLVFQLHNLLPHLSARQNVEMAMFGTGRHERERRRAADELLGAVGMADLVSSRPPELSGGERQRVALARALANDPRVVLADEPTGSLDPAMTEVVVELLRRRCETDGVTVLAVTHDERVLRAVDRVIHVVAGRVVG